MGLKRESWNVDWPGPGKSKDVDVFDSPIYLSMLSYNPALMINPVSRV